MSIEYTSTGLIHRLLDKWMLRPTPRGSNLAPSILKHTEPGKSYRTVEIGDLVNKAGKDLNNTMKSMVKAGYFELILEPRARGGPPKAIWKRIG